MAGNVRAHPVAVPDQLPDPVPDPAAPPPTLLTLPRTVISDIARRAHPTARLVCTTLAAASPPITSARPLVHPEAAALPLALQSLCSRHARTLTALDLSQIAFLHPPADLLPPLTTLPHLASITVCHCPALSADPDALPQICAFPSLTHLKISNDTFGPSQILQLATTATALRSLSLQIDLPTIFRHLADVTALSRLQALTRLELWVPPEVCYFSRDPHQDQDLLLATAANLPALQSLLLDEVLAFDPGPATAARLARLTHLTELKLALWTDPVDEADESFNNDEDETGSEALVALRWLGARLQHLDLHHNLVPYRALDACLEHLTALQSLRLTDMRAPKLRRLPALQCLSRLTALRFISCDTVQHSHDIFALRPLASTLQVLELQQVGRRCLPVLAILTALTELSLMGGHRVSEEWVAPMALRALRALRVLKLEGAVARRAVAVADEDADDEPAGLEYLTSLTALTLAHCELRDKHLVSGWLAGMQQLQVLDVRGNQDTLGAGLRVLMGLPRLRELALTCDRAAEGGYLHPLQHVVLPLPPPALERVRLVFGGVSAAPAEPGLLSNSACFLKQHGVGVLLWEAV